LVSCTHSDLQQRVEIPRQNGVILKPCGMHAIELFIRGHMMFRNSLQKRKKTNTSWFILRGNKKKGELMARIRN
jgi:hypothetical protein